METGRLLEARGPDSLYRARFGIGALRLGLIRRSLVRIQPGTLNVWRFSTSLQRVPGESPIGPPRP